MKHTSGPWEYGKAQNYDGFYIAPKGILPTLASVERGGRMINIMAHNFPGNCEANAKLISKTPELLEALKFLSISATDVLCKAPPSTGLFSEALHSLSKFVDNTNKLINEIEEK